MSRIKRAVNLKSEKVARRSGAASKRRTASKPPATKKPNLGTQAIQKGPKHRVFISYKREDQPIADAVKLALEALAFGKIVCVFDQQIKPGDQWAKFITSEIDKANWFILIYTGRADYENCIYEAVHYEASRSARGRVRKPRPLTCLHDTKDVPDALKKYQNYHIAPPDKDKSEAVSANSSIEQRSEFYKRSGCFKFLKSFVAVCNPHAQNSQSFSSQLLALSQEITTAFLNAVDPSIGDKVRHPRIALEFDGDTVVRIRKGTLDRVPDATKITNACDLNALSLLGVADSATTWQTIRSRFQSKQVNPDVGWMEEADQAILSAIRGENIPTIDLAVRALSDSSGAEIYSCVLSRQKEFRSGRQKLFLLFVRTRNRRLANDEQMAALLALQIMTTRFRFEVLKGPWSFQPNTSTKAVDQQAQQFLRLINKAECEAAEYGMSNAILNSAFDAKNRNALKVLSAQWHKDKEKLERTITAGKSSGEKVARINSFIMAWLPKNHDFLTMVSKQFLDRLQSDRASNI